MAQTLAVHRNEAGERKRLLVLDAEQKWKVQEEVSNTYYVSTICLRGMQDFDLNLEEEIEHLQAWSA